MLVVGFPMSPLTVLATIQHETTPGAGRKLLSIRISFGRETIAANIKLRSS
jgi:hypothetical protein